MRRLDYGDTIAMTVRCSSATIPTTSGYDGLG